MWQFAPPAHNHGFRGVGKFVDTGRRYRASRVGVPAYAIGYKPPLSLQRETSVPGTREASMRLALDCNDMNGAQLAVTQLRSSCCVDGRRTHGRGAEW